MTHDYRRHGTTTLFAALDMLDGTVLTQCRPRHRHQEFLSFLQDLRPDGELHIADYLGVQGKQVRHLIAAKKSRLFDWAELSASDENARRLARRDQAGRGMMTWKLLL